MSLLDSMMEDFTIVNKSKVPDGESGFVTVWTDGAVIKAALVLDSTMEAKVAEKSGVTSVYTVTTRRDVKLEYHDVIRRNSDGKVFRITSDPGDKVSPKVSGLDIAQVSAEKWSLTT